MKDLRPKVTTNGIKIQSLGSSDRIARAISKGPQMSIQHFMNLFIPDPPPPHPKRLFITLSFQIHVLGVRKF